MNILIPHTWLLEHLEADIEPKKLQEYLSLCGPSVERMYEREGDSVYDIEVTTNRADAMSVRGIAREAAAILPQFGVDAKLKPLTAPDVPNPSEELVLPTITENDELNKRTLCVVLSNVDRAPTPDWMAKRLTALDMQIHDAAIDITNYITHELGHPCHAFDYDKLVACGNQIIITEAEAGESFTLLDGATYTAIGGEVIFKDGTGTIIDLPSIKGTANSSVNANTKRILLLAESIDAKKVRFASMTHAIRTTAAQLMEKNADPTLAIDVIRLGVKLYREICGAKVASAVYDHFPRPNTHVAVTLTSEDLFRYLGVVIPLEEAKQMLERLECEVTIIDDSLVVTPPSFRPDLTIPADIVEEVARLYGYHKLPSKLMESAIPTNRPSGTNFTLEETVKEFLATVGWQEVYTYSMVSEAEALATGFTLEEHLKLSNPLTDDKVYLRRSLAPSLSAVLTANPMRQTLSVFEIANIYHPITNELPNEVLTLGIVSSAQYRDVRGILESLCTKLHITNFSIETEAGSSEATICFGKTQEVAGSISYSNGLTIIQIKISALVAHAQSHPTYQPQAKTAIIREDLTFKLPKKTAVGPIMSALEQLDPRITALELSTVYNENHTFTINYHDPNENLTSEQIAPLRKQLVAKVEQNWGGSLVGQLT
ncbi:MAG: phenylalanine--tRNA ligase subunit beta [Candidatus Pacebacteria bacterium]|nr:phenylalanine--tRNA ligase subunit beta [Candidatus Paceibacterota bacterium]